MAVITEYAHADARPHRRGFFARMLDAVVEARERQAEHLIRQHLATLDEETLRMWGYDPKSLKWTGHGTRF